MDTILEDQLGVASFFGQHCVELVRAFKIHASNALPIEEINLQTRALPKVGDHLDVGWFEREIEIV